ncbi:tRNA-specific adenosine deaminase [Aspergillus lucknowensis]|uniref:tRNA-specific adenosine deaminase n=1 Tax=Aspergillus lucknowensis TaxID=176173 RepID=A0ABR4M3I7_9EURO
MGDAGSETDPLPSRIATLVHAHFDGLPNRSKPTIPDDRTAEWIPMTGIVLVKGENTPSETLTCVAVTTGAKCLPASQIPRCKGLVLHDCHAETLAMRAFNFWLLSECQSVLAHERNSPSNRDENDSLSPYIWRRKLSISDHEIKLAATPPFEIQPDVRIYMYGTCAPCGDASMELSMAAQDDPTPWTIPSTEREPEPSDTGCSSKPQRLDGRAHFSKLGIVRRKPARADAESTKSKSCSDKLALRQVSSLLNLETSLLVAPTKSAYIAGLVLPEEEITRVGCARCFGGDGRMSGLRGRIWPVEAGSTGTDSQSEARYLYEFRPFQILSIPTEQLKSLWPFRRPRMSDVSSEEQGDGQAQTTPSVLRRSKPSNLSAIWVCAPTAIGSEDRNYPPSAVVVDTGTKSLPTLRGSRTGLFENIINGVRQGNKASSPGLRGASALSRAKLWSYAREIALSLLSSIEGEGFGGERGSAPTPVLQAPTYREFKKEPGISIDYVRARQHAIQSARGVLEGWIPNSGDENWGLDVLVDSKKRKR